MNVPMARRTRHTALLCPTFFGLLVLGAAWSQAARPAAGFVYENGAEFHAAPDVDGDGNRDVVVVDKSTGQFRVAQANNEGAITWRGNVGDSGLPKVTGFSAGRVLRAERDALIFSDALANRIQIVETPTDGRLTEPRRVQTESVGPKLATAINIPAGDGYDKDFLDLVYHATLHDPQVPDLLRRQRNRDGSLPFDPGPFSGVDGELNAKPERANRVRLEAGKIHFYAFMQDRGGSSAFQVLAPKNALDTGQPLAVLTGLPPDAAYVYADFDGDSNAEFVFFQKGSARLRESEWDGSGFTSLTNFSYPSPVAELRVINTAGSPELLVIRKGRDRADRVTYSGGGSFSVTETFSADGNAPIRGAIGLGQKLHLLDGGGNGLSARSRTFTYDGSKHTLTSSQKLTPLKPGDAEATVLLFDSPPLASINPELLARYDAGPWTSAFAIENGTPEVRSETFVDASRGLGDPVTESISGAPAATGGGLVNQTANDHSIFFQDPAVGEVTAQLSVTPSSGTYQRAFRPEFETTSGDPIADIFYRTTTRQKGWTSVGPQAPIILDDTTLYAVARTDSGDLSNVVKKDYELAGELGQRDSNNDGLPDFVAQQKGLDPLADKDDSDGDGFSDLREVLGGTNPTDKSSKPSRSGVAYELPNAFDLIAAPAVPDPDGGPPLRPFPDTGPQDGVAVGAHQPDGVFLGGAPTESVSSLAYPAATLKALDIVASDLFLVASTASNFPVDDGGPQNRGREVAGLVKPPELDFSPFEYDGFGDNGGLANLGGETSDWATAARNYYNGLQRPSVTRDPLGPDSTLALLLVERILGDKLAARGLTDRSNITLTPFRENESPLKPLGTEGAAADGAQPDRDRAVSVEALRALQRQPESGGAPYSVHAVIDTVRQKVANAPTTKIQKLKNLAERLYENSATETQSGKLRQPIDALREFLRSGSLAATGYDSSPHASDFPSSLKTAADEGADAIANAVSSRTVKTVTLVYDGPPENPDCPVWDEVSFTPGSYDPENPVLTGTQYTLVDDQGAPAPLTRAFPLTEGSVVRVTGFALPNAACGDEALEVIPQPELAFLRNASPGDRDRDLIPDSVESRRANASLDPFGDTDGDGYTDLQELMSASDPTDGGDVPMDGGKAAKVVDVTPPKLKIASTGANSAKIDFDYPEAFTRYIDFQLYSGSDPGQFAPEGKSARHTGQGDHELNVTASADKRFFILRMQLK